MTIDAVVFDIGGVLVDWQPHLAWVDELGEAEAKAFIARTGFDKINLACDGGVRFEDAAAHLSDPNDQALLAKYVARYTLTVPNKITETWDLLYALQNKGVLLHAITNWSAETWPEGLKAHPELGTVFGITIVSGEVGIVKPSVGIFQLLCDRADLRPEQCVFIDDGLHNCLGAKAAGMDAIHFTGAHDLQNHLTARGLL
ncbi:HAD-IA family hydrolase [Cognatishimia sp. MH4019]|uniref:HAD-IA family hydrolase n=1 Tax=Cognatishimia sp. MH4019 TaxID=2854030 RepID=UPI001CD40359|nr:HAD-IA family hydrolase [Cognatishimia sp. MH4019]